MNRTKLLLVFTLLFFVYGCGNPTNVVETIDAGRLRLTVSPSETMAPSSTSTENPSQTPTLTSTITSTPSFTFTPTASSTPGYTEYVDFINGFYQAIDQRRFTEAWNMETSEFQDASTGGQGFEYFEEFWTTFQPSYELAFCGPSVNKIAVHLTHYFRWDTKYLSPRPIQYWFEYTVAFVNDRPVIFMSSSTSEQTFSSCTYLLSYPSYLYSEN